MSDEYVTRKVAGKGGKVVEVRLRTIYAFGDDAKPKAEPKPEATTEEQPQA